MVRICFLFSMVLLTSFPAIAQNEEQGGGVVTAIWNADNVILPSSQVTPSTTWKAMVMVFNSHQRYTDAQYNSICGRPSQDSNGREWYEFDYSLTDGDQTWQQQTSPFSSDDYYLGHKSYQWITSDIMGDIYLRRSFTLNTPITGDLFLACGHDDAPAEYYINGVQVFATSDGWNNNERILLSNEQKALVKTDGTENVIALHVHQNWGGAFADCGLYEADMQRIVQLLPTLDQGPWPCTYYLLNSNEELAAVVTGDWARRCAYEDDWAWGYGPLSNSNDQFLTTYWSSERLPLLVRRHFTITSSQLQLLDDSSLELVCSYDENPKVFLNGSLIWQANGWNDNDYAHYVLTQEQKRLLKEGDNVLAVSLMSGNGGGHIDYGLSIIQPYHPADDGVTFPATHQTIHQTPYPIYNLNGQLVGNDVNALGKGIYVTNGRKIIHTK